MRLFLCPSFFVFCFLFSICFHLFSLAAFGLWDAWCTLGSCLPAVQFLLAVAALSHAIQSNACKPLAGKLVKLSGHSHTLVTVRRFDCSICEKKLQTSDAFSHMSNSVYKVVAVVNFHSWCNTHKSRSVPQALWIETKVAW